MPIRQQLADPVNAFIQGRAARQDHEYGQSRNALARMEAENAPTQMANRNALAQQSIEGQQMDLDAGKAKQAYAMLRQAMDSGNPRAFVMQHIPVLAAKIKEAQGVDLATVDDETANQIIDEYARFTAGKAGIEPAERPAQLETMEGPDGAILQRDPTTGALKQVIAPRKQDNFAATQAAADRRAREAREHAELMAQRQREWADDKERRKNEAKNAPNLKAAEQGLDSARNTLSAISDVKAKIGFNTTGVGGQFMRQFSGSEASNMEADLDTIKANIGFDRLQMMRDASKTGGALGGIAVQELNLLQSTIASLSVKQGRENLAKNIEKVENQYKKAVSAYEKALGLPPSQPQEFATEADAEAAGIQPGTRVIIGGVPGTWQ